MSDSKFLDITKNRNNLHLKGYDLSTFKPIYCQSSRIGFASPKVEKELQDFQNVFKISPDKIDICQGLKSYAEITEKVEPVLKQLKEKDIFESLRGWSNEKFDIRQSMGMAPLFAIERAACNMFGFLQYYINVTAYVVNDDESISVWLQRRALHKSRDPGKLDSFVAGGIASGDSIRETAIKESEEEANLPKYLSDQLKPTGCISYFYQTDDLELVAVTEYVFDLEVPKSFVPINNDGQVEGFVLVPIPELMKKICTPDVKPAAAQILLDFLIRRGFITFESDPNLPTVIEMLHAPLHQFYKS